MSKIIKVRGCSQEFNNEKGQFMKFDYCPLASIDQENGLDCNAGAEIPAWVKNGVLPSDCPLREGPITVEVDVKIPNELTAQTLDKSERGEDLNLVSGAAQSRIVKSAVEKGRSEFKKDGMRPIRFCDKCNGPYEPKDDYPIGLCPACDQHVQIMKTMK